MLTDANGVGRGKIIRRHELLSLYEDGRHLPISILGLDITGEDVHETGLIWDSGDGDLRAWPIPGTLEPLHGTAPARGQVLMSMYQLDGAPMTSDPRHALARQVDAFAAKGLLPGRRLRARILPARQRARCRRPRAAGHAPCSTAAAAARPRSIRSTICMAWSRCSPTSTPPRKLQGIPAETVISEYAPGQYELTLNYRKDVHAGRRRSRPAEAAGAGAGAPARRHRLLHGQADREICRLRHAFPRLAAGRARAATSLPRQREGAWSPNAAACARRPRRRPWRNPCWSLRRTPIPGGASCAQSYAPVAPTWGVNNRSVALRMPAGDARSRRIEHRPSGVDANPYLVAATVLAGIAKGLDEKLDPGPETTGNGYEAAPDTAAPCRPTGARPSKPPRPPAFLKQALGADMHRTFTAIKQAEYLRVARTVSELDYHLYLHEV